MKGRILVVDDEPSIRQVLTDILVYSGYAVVSVGSGAEALITHRKQPVDLILLDVKMQGIDGIDTLAQLREQDPHVRVIMISGHGSVATAVQAVRNGAFDFLEKPLDADRLLFTVQRALDNRMLVTDVNQLRDNATKTAESRFTMVGNSASLQRVRKMVERVGPTNARVLITGENGTGKELVARAIHEMSGRRKGPFVEVNCAAIPSELVESELFGHVKGSFTGATGDQLGKFDAANGGTLFLDEIGDLALNAQAKILRALQEGVIVRVGDARAIAVDVRVIAATNRDLAGEIAEGRFREDLYFRLNVMQIEVSPLRDRRSDIPALVNHFVAALGGGPGMTSKRFSEEAIARLQLRNWAGNVRELRNAVERLLILSQGEEVTADDVAQLLPTEQVMPPDVMRLAGDAPEMTLEEFRQHAGAAIIRSRLNQYFWNISEAARSLGVSRSALYKHMKGHGIDKEGP